MFPPINNMSEIGSDNGCVPIGKSLTEPVLDLCTDAYIYHLASMSSLKAAIYNILKAMQYAIHRYWCQVL